MELETTAKKRAIMELSGDQDPYSHRKFHFKNVHTRKRYNHMLSEEKHYIHRNIRKKGIVESDIS